MPIEFATAAYATPGKAVPAAVAIATYRLRYLPMNLIERLDVITVRTDSDGAGSEEQIVSMNDRNASKQGRC